MKSTQAFLLIVFVASVSSLTATVRARKLSKSGIHDSRTPPSGWGSWKDQDENSRTPPSGWGSWKDQDEDARTPPSGWGSWKDQDEDARTPPSGWGSWKDQDELGSARKPPSGWKLWGADPDELSSAQEVTRRHGFKRFKSNLSPLPGYSVTGKVHFAMTSTGSSQIIFSGKLRGLETSLNSTSCDTTAHANSCGVHIHAGKSCAERGPHFFAGTTDIWTDVQYTSTNAKGKAKFTRILKKGVNTDIDGRVFVVHNAAGQQVACGKIESRKAPSGGHKISQRRLIRYTPAVRFMANYCKCGCKISEYNPNIMEIIASVVIENFGRNEAMYAINNRERITYKHNCKWPSKQRRKSH